MGKLKVLALVRCEAVRLEFLQHVYRKKYELQLRVTSSLDRGSPHRKYVFGKGDLVLGIVRAATANEHRLLYSFDLRPDRVYQLWEDPSDGSILLGDIISSEVRIPCQIVRHEKDAGWREKLSDFQQERETLIRIAADGRELCDFA